MILQPQGSLVQAIPICRRGKAREKVTISTNYNSKLDRYKLAFSMDRGLVEQARLKLGDRVMLYFNNQDSNILVLKYFPVGGYTITQGKNDQRYRVAFPWSSGLPWTEAPVYSDQAWAKEHSSEIWIQAPESIWGSPILKEANQQPAMPVQQPLAIQPVQPGPMVVNVLDLFRALEEKDQENT